jgi:hypothetical protein
MTDALDERIANAIQRAAPAARDPLFRIKLLERREIERYRRGVRVLAALGAAAAGGFALAAVSLGPGAVAALVAGMCGIAAAGIGFAHAPLLLRLGRRRR